MGALVPADQQESVLWVENLTQVAFSGSDLFMLSLTAPFFLVAQGKHASCRKSASLRQVEKEK